MLCHSLFISAVIRTLCAFLSCFCVHFIYAYCTAFIERINDDDDDDDDDDEMQVPYSSDRWR